MTIATKPEPLYATYTKDYCKVVVAFHADGEVEFSAIGLTGTEEEQNATLLALAEAGGGNVDGWECKLS